MRNQRGLSYQVPFLDALHADKYVIFATMRQCPWPMAGFTKGNCFPTLRDEGTLTERHRNLMTYPEAIRFLYDLRWFGTKLGLTNTFKLAALAGHPQRGLNFIHVAGTNGKGSTCAMLESIYRAAGLRVGLFTSPHLVSFRERIQVNRQLIAESAAARLVEEMQRLLARFDVVHRASVQPADSKGVSARSLSSGGAKSPPTGTPDAGPTPPTFFEVVTVMALRYFAEQKCDLVIWETGLGGRLDATNIVTPLASVITNIQYDHQKWLGHTRAEIA